MLLCSVIMPGSLRICKLDPANKGLPHPSSSLFMITLTLSIAAANEEVKIIVIARET